MTTMTMRERRNELETLRASMKRELAKRARLLADRIDDIYTEAQSIEKDIRMLGLRTTHGGEIADIDSAREAYRRIARHITPPFGG